MAASPPILASFSIDTVKKSAQIKLFEDKY